MYRSLILARGQASFNNPLRLIIIRAVIFNMARKSTRFMVGFCIAISIFSGLIGAQDRVCRDNYYGTDCSVFCISNSELICNEAGELVNRGLGGTVSVDSHKHLRCMYTSYNYSDPYTKNRFMIIISA